MEKRAWVAFALLFGLAIALFFWGQGQKQEMETSFVQRVIDGDTIVLANGARARLIGINASEKGAPCFEESKGELQALVSGKAVELFFDVELRDKYGRLLVYIFSDGNFVNIELVEKGLAVAFPFEPNLRHAEEFAEAEKNAREQRKGCLWAAGPSA